MDVIYDWFYRAFVLDQLRFYSWLPSVLLISIPVIIWAYISFQRKRRWRLTYPITNILSEIPRVSRVKRPSRHLAFIFRVLVVVLIILSAMRPQMGKTREEIKTHGVDIMLTLDISHSMLAEDFRPNRVEAAKDVLADFVRRNTSDRLGLVVFSGMAFTQCPVTSDTAILEEFIYQVDVGDVIESGTAIGDAIITSVARFPDEDVPSKVIILLTDGEHNILTTYDPIFAARIANRKGVRIYTIGVGSRNPTPIPDPNMPGGVMRNSYGQVVYTKLDEETLRDIASLTGGRYFRAEDEEALADIYREIEQLETHEIEQHRFVTYTEIFQNFLLAALILLGLELIARQVWGRALP